MEIEKIDILGDEIINKALEFGASLAGIANIEELKRSPSNKISSKIFEFSRYSGVGTKRVEGIKPGEVKWHDQARSAIVIAIEHPKEVPEMDWWVKGLKGGTTGNSKLMVVITELALWLEKEKQIKCIKLPYHIEYGAIYMKDAAVLAGLGCIGKSNVLVTPKFGPRVRLRVMLLEKELPSTGLLDFDPCLDCKEFCRHACPERAFRDQAYMVEEFGKNELPGRTGVYSRHLCNLQMEKNKENGKDVLVNDTGQKGREVRYCRRCELACPVGRK